MSHVSNPELLTPTKNLISMFSCHLHLTVLLLLEHGRLGFYDTTAHEVVIVTAALIDQELTCGQVQQVHRIVALVFGHLGEYVVLTGQHARCWPTCELLLPGLVLLG